jgi:hypothetical protein
MHRSRGLATGALVAVVCYLFLAVWMRGDVRFAILMSLIVGLGVASVVGTAKDPRNIAADAAWQAAAPDLPPGSERRELVRDQTHMPGPQSMRAGSTPKSTPKSG